MPPPQLYVSAVDNPVITVPEEENNRIASSRSSIVNSFLTSEEFTEVLPEGITIASGSNGDIGNGSDGDNGNGGGANGSDSDASINGSVSLVVSMAMLLGIAMLAIER